MGPATLDWAKYYTLESGRLYSEASLPEVVIPQGLGLTQDHRPAPLQHGDVLSGPAGANAASSYFSSCRSLCRSSWVATGSEMSEAMLGVGSLTNVWLGEQAAPTCRLEELLPRPRGPGGLASAGGARSSTPGLSPPPMTGVGGAVLLLPAPGDVAL